MLYYHVLFAAVSFAYLSIRAVALYWWLWVNLFPTYSDCKQQALTRSYCLGKPHILKIEYFFIHPGLFRLNPLKLISARIPVMM